MTDRELSVTLSSSGLWASLGLMEAAARYRATWDGTSWVLYRGGAAAGAAEWNLILRDWTCAGGVVRATTGAKPCRLELRAGLVCADLPPADDRETSVALREYLPPPRPGELEQRAVVIAVELVETHLGRVKGSLSWRLGLALAGQVPNGSAHDVLAAFSGSARRSKEFLLATGSTPGGYLRRLRLEASSSLMAEHPDTPLGKIAAAVGFGSFSGFCRAFRKAFGNTPAAYRHLLLAAAGGFQ